jgi:hypothetical protein
MLSAGATQVHYSSYCGFVLSGFSNGVGKYLMVSGSELNSE